MRGSQAGRPHFVLHLLPLPLPARLGAHSHGAPRGCGGAAQRLVIRLGRGSDRLLRQDGRRDLQRARSGNSPRLAVSRCTFRHLGCRGVPPHACTHACMLAVPVHGSTPYRSSALGAGVPLC